MARVLSYPFRVGTDGSLGTVDEATDQADVEEVAMVLLTVRGERPLVPAYGIEDPAFVGIRAPEVVAACTRWTPLVVTSVDVSADGPTTQLARVTIR